MERKHAVLSAAPATQIAINTAPAITSRSCKPPNFTLLPFSLISIGPQFCSLRVGHTVDRHLPASCRARNVGEWPSGRRRHAKPYEYITPNRWYSVKIRPAGASASVSCNESVGGNALHDHAVAIARNPVAGRQKRVALAPGATISWHSVGEASDGCHSLSR